MQFAFFILKAFQNCFWKSIDFVKNLEMTQIVGAVGGGGGYFYYNHKKEFWDTRCNSFHHTLNFCVPCFKCVELNVMSVKLLMILRIKHHNFKGLQQCPLLFLTLPREMNLKEKRQFLFFLYFLIMTIQAKEYLEPSRTSTIEFFCENC